MSDPRDSFTLEGIGDTYRYDEEQIGYGPDRAPSRSLTLGLSDVALLPGQSYPPAVRIHGKRVRVTVELIADGD